MKDPFFMPKQFSTPNDSTPNKRASDTACSGTPASFKENGRFKDQLEHTETNLLVHHAYTINIKFH